MWTCSIFCFFFFFRSCIALGVVDELQELVYFRGWGCAGFCVLLWTCEGSVCTNGAGNLRAKLQEQQGSADEMSPLLTQHPRDTGAESLWGWDQFGLQSEFQTSLGYRVRPCIKNTNDNNNKKSWRLLLLPYSFLLGFQAVMLNCVGSNQETVFIFFCSNICSPAIVLPRYLVVCVRMLFFLPSWTRGSAWQGDRCTRVK